MHRRRQLRTPGSTWHTWGHLLLVRTSTMQRMALTALYECLGRLLGFCALLWQVPT